MKSSATHVHLNKNDRSSRAVIAPGALLVAVLRVAKLTGELTGEKTHNGQDGN